MSCKSTSRKTENDVQPTDTITDSVVDLASYFTEQLDPQFEEYLTYFEENIPGEDNDIILPPNTDFYKRNKMEDIKIPGNYLNFLNFKINKFEELETEHERFNSSVEMGNPFYAIARFKASRNINSVVVVHTIPEVPMQHAQYDYHLLINYNCSGTIISILPLAYSFEKDSLKISSYTKIFTPSCLKRLEHISSIDTSLSEELVNTYSINNEGGIDIKNKNVNNIEYFVKEWLKITEENGEQFIYYYCEALPQSIKIREDNGVYKMYHGLGQDSRLFKILSFRSYPHLDKYDIILTQEYMEGERWVTVKYNDDTRNTATWINLADWEEKMNFATKSSVDVGIIETREEEGCEDYY